MPFTNRNDYLDGRKPIPAPSGSEDITVRFALAVTTGDLALNNIGQIGVLPAGCVPVEVRVDGSDVDSGAAAMVLQVGIWDGAAATLSTAAADGGAHWGVTTAVNTAFDQALTRNGQALAAVAKADVDRRLGVRVTTAPTTPVAGTLGVTLTYRNA